MFIFIHTYTHTHIYTDTYVWITSAPFPSDCFSDIYISYIYIICLYIEFTLTRILLHPASLQGSRMRNTKTEFLR